MKSLTKPLVLSIFQLILLPFVVSFIFLHNNKYNSNLPLYYQTEIPEIRASTATLMVTPTPTNLVSSTQIPTAISSPITENSPTPSPLQIIYAPIVVKQPTPTPSPVLPDESIIYCDQSIENKYIPDNNKGGITNSIVINDPRFISDLDILIDISHTWVGDLSITLAHKQTGNSVVLIDRPGVPMTSTGCGSNNINAILDDEISSPVETKCAGSPAAISGIYIPHQLLSSFDLEAIQGDWELNITDNYKNDTGKLNKWCLISDVSKSPTSPPPTPAPPSSPNKANISGVTGKNQAFPLDCESRSAVDWANYFGKHIDELEFFNRLPHSDNPDKGFVGNVYGTWGQIPPNPYGVHAQPVANLLQQYGLSAYSHRAFGWYELRSEIASGNPVIVWIIGSVQNGIPVFYTSSDGVSTIVARYEHTVIVTGYTSDRVTYLNGKTLYTTSLEQFLDSWSALDNMAITISP